MKICSFRTISSLFLAGVFLLSSVANSGARAQEGGRLVIWRIPSLGNDVIVDVRIDGQPAGSILYGHHFETTLAPGRHVIMVQATPRPFFRNPFTITLHVKSGRLYNFTAKSGSSQLILVRS